MSFAPLQNYGLEMKTGINAIIYSGEQSLSTHALLNSVFFFFFYCLFCKIFTFFFFWNVLFISQQPMEIKLKQITLGRRNQGVYISCSREGDVSVESPKNTGPGGADGAAWAGPGPSAVCGAWWQEVTCGVIFSPWERRIHPDPYHHPVSKKDCVSPGV